MDFTIDEGSSNGNIVTTMRRWYTEEEHVRGGGRVRAFAAQEIDFHGAIKASSNVSMSRVT
jgi:hypothetical protein